MLELASTLGLALAAGLLSFFAPCVLPLIPVYLSFLAGTHAKSSAPPGRGATLRQALGFVAGFSVIFVALGAAASALGQVLYDALPVLRQVGGVLLILMGLHLLGWLRIPLLYRESRLNLDLARRAGGSTSFVVGIVFAAGWTPCVGPVLASILTLAADSRSMPRGVLLLSFYAAGLAIPFILSAFAVEATTRRIRRIGPHLRKVEAVSGALVCALGVLLLFDAFGRLSQYVDYWTPPL